MRILIADDHPNVRAELAKLLCQDPTADIIGEATDGEMAVELAHKLLPDLVIMDIRMPKLNGIEATRRIVSDHPGIRVIGFSIYSNRRLRAEMLDAGAVDCISKSDSSKFLMARIHNYLQ